MEALPLYESIEMRAVTGPAIRPGGLTLTERALDLCCIPDGAKVLDVGCGVGATVEFLCRERHCAAFGVDTSSLLLKEGMERNPTLPLLQGTAESLPFRDGSFNALFCECVLSLLPDPASALKEFARVLSPEGFVMLSDVYARMPDEASSLPHLPVRCCIKGAVGMGQIITWVEESGLTVVTWEDHSALLKQLAAQLIFSFGSLNAFWAATCSEGFPDAIEATVRRARPGYYLLIAQRKERDHG
jgi:ubiquinone/menaquinone biosynthesis C-methylase UbiE